MNKFRKECVFKRNALKTCLLFKGSVGNPMPGLRRVLSAAEPRPINKDAPKIVQTSARSCQSGRRVLPKEAVKPGYNTAKPGYNNNNNNNRRLVQRTKNELEKVLHPIIIHVTQQV